MLDLDELFAAAETLGRVRPLRATAGDPHERRGIGILAVDRLVDLGGTLADMSPDTMLKLNSALPPIWSHANPVDIAGDADPARYVAALERLIADPANDAILVMNVPLRSPRRHRPPQRSRRRAGVSQQHGEDEAYFAVWVGTSAAVTPIFEADGIPSYETESEAVHGFMHLVRYREAQDALMATPPSLPQDFKPDLTTARTVVANAVQRGRTWLDPIEMTRLLEASSIPFAPRSGPRADEAAATARPGWRRIGGGGQNPLAGYRSQIGGGRRQALPHQRGGGPRGRHRDPRAGEGRET